MTRDEAQAKAEQLSKDLNAKIEALIISNPDDENDLVVGFLKMPSRNAKRAILDEMLKSGTGAGQMYLESSLMKDQSDPRLSSPDSDCDAIVIGAELACLGKVDVWQADLKKK